MEAIVVLVVVAGVVAYLVYRSRKSKSAGGSYTGGGKNDYDQNVN